MRGIKKLAVYSREMAFVNESLLDLRAPDLSQTLPTLAAGADGDDGKHGVHGPSGKQQQHLYSSSTRADADKVKKINNISVSTQLSLELK